MNKLFIHIPKTGGTSLKLSNASITQLSESNRYRGHEPLFLLEQKYDLKKYYIFTIVRNPYDRAISYYKHFNSVNNLNYSFKEFLYIVMSKGSQLVSEFVKDKSHLKFIQTTPMIFYDQSYYIKSFKNYKVDIFKLEKIEKLEQKLNIKLPFANKGTIMDIKYDNETTKLVKHIYKDDFTNFNYSA